MSDLAQIVMERIEALGKISDEPGRLTRSFCSPAMRRANDLVAAWMREAGMEVRQDAIGNLIGHHPARSQASESSKSKVQSPKSGESSWEKVLLLGSHLDTVRDAGRFDGPLGVMVAIAGVQKLHDAKIRLPFALEVVGFADEEGVRYQSTYLGSKVLAGTFNADELKRADADGVTMADAIRRFGGNPEGLAEAKLDPRHLLGYVEVHIEQGPVLEQRNLAVGVVSAIAGQTRKQFRFCGRAGHAGTVPMNLRADALCAAAEFVLAVETCARNTPGLVATVGEIAALPGASNVIPGEVWLSLDVRHAEDTVRESACARLRDAAKEIAEGRRLEVRDLTSHDAPAVVCDQRLTRILEDMVKRHQPEAAVLSSGAGHDAAAMAAITPVAMLFVRCRGGISHHPDESVAVEDVGMAMAVMDDFIRQLAQQE